MKKLLILPLLIVCIIGKKANAQAPFAVMDSIDINNINESILVHGDMGWNPIEQNAHCYFPAGSKASINFVNALWMSGYDDASNLHVAAQTYRQSGNDYWPGPIDGSTAISYASSREWAKIWKVNLTDIQTFLGLTTHTIATTPPSILTWPGKGNIYAQGSSGAALTVSSAMAPFVDLNGNGIYEPLLGEYPAIKGMQSLWLVMNDNGPNHGQTNGLPLGVEIHAMIWGLSRSTLIDNVVYYDYTIVNKSAHNYHNFRMGLFDDVDLGYYLDDYIGFDSTWRMGICYNGTNDEGAAGGHPVNSYGKMFPIVGVTMVVLPGDAGTSYVPAGSFDEYYNFASIIGYPSVDTEYNNYLHSKTSNGRHFIDNFIGAGGPCDGILGTGPNTNYLYTGDPGNGSQWSECTCGDNPGDRRFILASNDFTLAAGSSQHIVLALVSTNLDSNNGCPKVNFDKIKIVADTAWRAYYDLLATGMPDISPANAIKVYPNPAHNRLFIESADNMANVAAVTLYNTLGQKVTIPFSVTGKKSVVDISKLPEGLYYLQYRYNGVLRSAKFIKE